MFPRRVPLSLLQDNSSIRFSDKGSSNVKERMSRGAGPPPLCLIQLLPRLPRRDEDKKLLLGVGDVTLQESHAPSLRKRVVQAEVKLDAVWIIRPI